MALRGKKPEDRKQRLKLLLSGEAGVGKTTATLEFPAPYIIDTEQGTLHYGEAIEKAGGAVFEATGVQSVIDEVRSLMTEPHPYKTLVIDPITTVFNDALEDAERKVGNEFGRHYGEANKHFKRLCGLLTTIDMNVVITAHEKNEYGPKLEVIGKTFDGYKKLDYIFDLWLILEKEKRSKNGPAGKRFAFVRKTRLAEFPDGERFEFTRDNLLARYGADRLEKNLSPVALASAEQVERFNLLLNSLSDSDIKLLKIDKALSDVDDVADLPADRIARGIEIMEQHKARMRAA